MKRLFILLGIFVLTPCLTFGQIQRIGVPFLHNYKRTEYNAGAQNWSIVQDSRGIMYFGNRFGVLEFDGVSWKHINLSKKTIGRSLQLGSEGQVYVGGQGEFGYLWPDSIGNMSYYPLWTELPDKHQNFDDVWRILAVENGTSFHSGAAIFIKREQGYFDIITPPKANTEFYRTYAWHGRFYASVAEEGLFVIEGNQLLPAPGSEDLKNVTIVDILPYREDEALIFTYKNGVFVYDKKSVKAWTGTVNEFLENNLVYCVARLRDGTYAVGTSENGLFVFDRARNPILHVNKEGGLQNNTVLSICEDRSGNLWLGLDNGISFIELNSPFSMIRTSMGLQGTPYASRLHDGQIYFGTTNGVYQTSWNELTSPLKTPKLQLLPNSKGQVYGISEVGGELLLSHHLHAFRISPNQASAISDVQGSWMFLELNQFPGYMIEGTYTGLNLYKKEGNGWSFVRRLEGFNESSRIMEQDDKGNIWMAHGNKGIYKIQLREDLTGIEKVRFYNSKDGFPSDIFTNVYRIKGELLFSAEKGMYKYDDKKDAFVPNPKWNALFGEETYVRRLVEDLDGNVWFQVDEDFGVLRSKGSGRNTSYEKRVFPQMKGRLLPGFEHIYPYASGKLFIGTQEEFVHYDDNIQAFESPPFSSLIREVHVGDGKTNTQLFGGTFTENDSIVLHPLGAEEGYTLTSSIHSFWVSFSTNSYEGASQMKYSCWLEGLEEGWSDWSLNNEKNYTNLPSGSYTFHVKSMNISGEEGEEAILQFKIRTPWYRTIWAYIVYVALILGLIAYLYRWNLLQIEQEKSALEQEQQEKIRKKEQELKEKEMAYKEESERSAAEIIQLRNDKLETEISYKTKELALSAMHLVKKGEVMNKIKSDIVKISKQTTEPAKKQLERVVKDIEHDMRLDKSWEQFEILFDEVHGNFIRRLKEKYPNLTPKELKLCTYLRLNLSTKEIAPLMSISVRGVEISRYRLRKKLDLDSSKNLTEFLMVL